MEKLRKERFEESGGNLPRQKIKLSRRTKIVSFIFSVMTILTTAGIMQAANVYYDLDTDTIMVNDAQTMSLGLTVAGGTINLNATGTGATNIGTSATAGVVTIGGGSNDVIINSDTWDVSNTGTMTGANVVLRAGVAAVGGSPLTFTAGPVLTTPVAGAMEFNSTGSVLTFTPVATRYPVGLISTGVTTGKICTYNSATATIDCDTDSATVGHSAVTLTAIGVTPNANGMSISSQVLNLEPANASFGGVVTTGAQTFAGAKTLNSALTIGVASTASGDITLYNAGSTFWQKIATSVAGSNQTYTLPTTGGTFAMTSDINAFEASGILRGQVNIFGFDYPAQCSTSCLAPTYKTVSREIQALPNFPAVLANATRTYRLVIRYGADLVTNGDDVTVVAYNTTTSVAIATWTIDQPVALNATVEKGYVYVSGDFTAPATDDWDVRVSVPASGIVRIYSIELAAYDIN